MVHDFSFRAKKYLWYQSIWKCIKLYYSLRVFHTSVCWWSSTGVSVTACLLVSGTLLSILDDLNNAVVPYLFSFFQIFIFEFLKTFYIL